METYKTIGNNIKLFRDNLKLTQENVANFLGISRPILSYYESGERKAPIEHLNKLTDLFGIELKDLLEENLDSTKVNVALAFSADNLNDKDLETISNFRKFVKNYFKMIRIEQKNVK